MSCDVHVEVAPSGHPLVRVPRDLAWDLVEYLAVQRVHVSYSFEAEKLVVNFDHMEPPSVQMLIDGWRHSRGPDSPQNEVSRADQWLAGSAIPKR